MPITAASIAAQRLDEYLQRAVASCEDTPQINLGHSSNRGASLLTHISRARGSPVPFSRDSVPIKPSDVRKAGGKVTAAGGLITVKNDERVPSGSHGAKRAKLDDKALSRVGLTDRKRTNQLYGIGEKDHQNKAASNESADHSILSSGNKYLFKRDLKLQRESRPLDGTSRTTDRIGALQLLNEVNKDPGSKNTLIKAQENAKRARLFHSGETDMKIPVSSSEQSVSSPETVNVSSNLNQKMISLKSLTDLDKRLSPQPFSFSVSEKVQTNLLKLPSHRLERSSPLIPASQLGSGLDETLNQTRQALRTRSRSPAQVLGNLQQGLSESGSETNTYGSFNQLNLDSNEDVGSASSHLPYENIFNPDNPFNRPSVGLSEMFDDSSFDYVNSYLLPNSNFNRDNSSPSESAMKSLNNEGRILLGNGSASAFDLVTDSCGGSSTPRFDIGIHNKGASRSRNFKNRISCYTSSVATRLRQTASHTVTSASADDETKSSKCSSVESPSVVDRTFTIAALTRPPSQSDRNEKSEKCLMKSADTALKVEAEKKLEPPTPGGIKRAGPYLLGKYLYGSHEVVRYLNPL